MNQCAIQPQLMTIYKEVHICTDVDILVAGLFYYAEFDTRCQERLNFVELWQGTSNSLVLIRQPQLHYSEIRGTNFHLLVTRMD
jgi:hypothetical protein